MKQHLCTCAADKLKAVWSPASEHFQGINGYRSGRIVIEELSPSVDGSTPIFCEVEQVNSYSYTSDVLYLTQWPSMTSQSTSYSFWLVSCDLNY